jgi:hypothetical protein
MIPRSLLHAAAVSAACATPALAEPGRDFGALETGIQLSGRVGYGAWSEGETAAFFPGASGAAVGSVAPGTAYAAELLYRTSPTFAVGLGGAWSSGAADGAARSAGSRDLRAVARFLSGTPWAFSEWAFDVSGGLGTFTARGGDGSELSAEAYTLGARASLDVRPVEALPWARVGPFVSADAWIARSRCAGGSCADVELAEPANLLLSVGLSLRFDVPLTYAKQPEYVAVDSEVQVATAEATAPEVTDTPQYRAELPVIRQVALQAPSECASRTAAAATGQGTATGTLVKTECGVEMGELERALTRAGFAVQSWTSLAALVRDEKISPREAAARMGAQVLFQVNSLEKVRAAPVTGAKWERRYFVSDVYGRRGAPASLPESERSVLREFVARPESDWIALTGQRLGAMLDVNAVMVSSGQSIWFYRWQRLDTPTAARQVSALARRVDGGPWVPVAPAPLAPAALPVDERRSVESGERVSGGAPEDPADAAYFRLMREVVTDFVQRFTHGGPAR